MMRWEFHQNPVMKDLVGHDEDLGIHSVHSGKLSEGLTIQGSVVVSLTFHMISLSVVGSGVGADAFTKIKHVLKKM